MSIAATDIKLLASERMSDASDGGGRMTTNEIVSGVMGNIFPKVSRTDAVAGRVNLRKIYAAVRSATLDMYGGAHAIIADAPDDAKLSAVLFSTGSAFDTRSSARDRIESYVVMGGLSTMRLYGSQIVGSKAIVAYQRPEETLPEAGDVLCLSVEASGYPAAQQYARITDYTHEVRTFTDAAANLDFPRRVLTIKISTPLNQTFVGMEPTRAATDPSPTKMRSTIVADASKYYGIQPLAAGVPANALACVVDSVYGQVVPSTNREAPLSMAEVGGALLMRSAAAVDFSYAAVGVPFFSAADRRNFKLPGSILPGSLSIAWGGKTAGDDGRGALTGGFLGGSIDYAAGTLTEVRILDGMYTTFTLVFTYMPAAEIGQPAHTRALPVTLATRGSVYAVTLDPMPAPATVRIDYRALGRWYSLTDDGNGALTANGNAIGTGSITYDSGRLTVTLGALPDVGSSVMLSWGSPIHTAIRAGASSDAGATVHQSLALPGDKLPVAPGSFSCGYLVNGVLRTITSDTAGVLSGPGATGRIDQSSGRAALEFTDKLPDFGSAIALAWQQLVPTTPGAAVQVTYAGAVGTANVIDLAADPGFASLKPGSFSGTLTIDRPAAAPALVTLSDDGAGGVKVGPHTVGSIDYATGVVLLSATLTSQVSYVPYSYMWFSTPIIAPVGTRFSCVYTPAAVGTATAPATASVDSAPTVDLTRSIAQPIVPGTVIFSLAGKSYWDKAGTLYTHLDATSNATIAAGSINYASGACTIGLWNNNAAPALAVHACLSAYGEATAIEADFRTAGSPLRPASFYVQVSTLDGELISGTADTNGIISGPCMRGTVQQTMGVVHVEFGSMAPAAGLETEPWYAAADIVDGMIWRPREVLPSTLRYNAVVITNLPLDPTLLGLDPVRLPMDGRVPIYRPGDIVVLHHSDATALANPVVNGTTYSLGRGDLATVALTDSDGTAVNDALWSSNLVAGTITIAADADLSAYAQPLIAAHRIEQMNLVTDVQINGGISFSAPVTRAYPSGAHLSSALPFGDLVARVSNVFDQATWSGAWADAVVGSAATAQFNDVAYPIVVRNDGAVTERWRINFTGATTFALIGENLGQIATGTTGVDLAPMNPLTGQPFFTLAAAGWGGGWATGNQLRFNTFGANAPIWIARTVLGGAGLGGDALTVEIRGDTN